MFVFLSKAAAAAADDDDTLPACWHRFKVFHSILDASSYSFYPCFSRLSSLSSLIARHAVWQDEKISHSLKSSAAATLQSLRNVPVLPLLPLLPLPHPIPIPFQSQSMSMSMSLSFYPSMAGAGQLVSILVFSFEFGFRLQFGGFQYFSSFFFSIFSLSLSLSVSAFAGVSLFGSWLNKLYADYMWQLNEFAAKHGLLSK